MKCRILFHFLQSLSLDWVQYVYFCPPVSDIFFQSHMKQIMTFFARLEGLQKRENLIFCVICYWLYFAKYNWQIFSWTKNRLEPYIYWPVSSYFKGEFEDVHFLQTRPYNTIVLQEAHGAICASVVSKYIRITDVWAPRKQTRFYCSCIVMSRQVDHGAIP